MAIPRAPSPRRQRTTQRILDAAGELFNLRGVRGVGVDDIAEHAGVAKMTLYHHFASKEDIVHAWLTRTSDRWMLRLSAAVDAPGLTPRERVLAVFDVLLEWFREPTFRGCPFVNTAAQSPGADDPCRKAALLYKRRNLQYVTGLVQAAGISNPVDVATELLLLAEGATVSAAIWGGPEPARRARAAAAKILGSSSLGPTSLGPPTPVRPHARGP